MTSNTAQGCSPNWFPPPGTTQPPGMPVSGLTGAVGGSGILGAYVYGNDCFGNEFWPISILGTYYWSALGASWTYSASGVASVDSSGNVSYAAKGSTNVGLTNVYINAYDYDWSTGHCKDFTGSYTTVSNEQAPVTVTCGTNDNRDNLIPEYAPAAYGADFVPACPEFTGAAHSFDYSFPQLNVSDAGHYPEWAILRDYFLTGLNKTITNYASPAPTMNSAYRSPQVNYNIETAAGTGHFGDSRHIHGDAGDLASNSSTWTSLHDAAKAAGACVEPTSAQGGSTAHVHVDWRGACPNLW